MRRDCRALAAPAVPQAEAPARSRELFSPQELVCRQIAGLQPDRITPMEALALLAKLKRELAEGGTS